MKIGLVLSGGGMRGVAHIGAIKALGEYEIVPTHIAGTSSGAIVGAFFAKGYAWNEILEFFRKLSIFSVSRYALNKPGFIDSEKFYLEFQQYFPEDDFSSLKIPLWITATNILNGNLQTFHQGPLIKPLLASASFPGVFTPVPIEDSFYVDGGVLNNFPVESIRSFCDKVIGVYVNPFEYKAKEYFKHSYNVLEQAYQIKNAKESFPKFQQCDLVILPKGLRGIGMFAFKQVDQIFNLGYEEAKIQLDSEIGKQLFNSEGGT